MWWFLIALGLEPSCIVIRGVPCGASDLLLQLFWSQATSPQPLFWHSHLKCLVGDCHLFKSLFQHLKTVAPVQVNLNLKRRHIFVVAKIGQTNFVKSRIMQGLRISSSWNFVLCILFSKIPKVPFSWENGTVCFMAIFLCMQNWSNQFYMIKYPMRVF